MEWQGRNNKSCSSSLTINDFCHSQWVVSVTHGSRSVSIKVIRGDQSSTEKSAWQSADQRDIAISSSFTSLIDRRRTSVGASIEKVWHDMLLLIFPLFFCSEYFSLYPSDYKDPHVMTAAKLALLQQQEHPGLLSPIVIGFFFHFHIVNHNYFTTSCDGVSTQFVLNTMVPCPLSLLPLLSPLSLIFFRKKRKENFFLHFILFKTSSFILSILQGKTQYNALREKEK